MDFEIDKKVGTGEVTLSEVERDILTNRLITSLINKASTDGTEVLSSIEGALYHVLLDTKARRQITVFGAGSRYLNILHNAMVGVNTTEDLEESNIAALLAKQLDEAIVEIRAYETEQEVAGIIDSFEIPDTIDELNT